MGYIYYIKNLINNKYYIGQTINNLNERWNKHKHKNSNCKYLKNSFIKYNLENFEFKLICICFDNDLNKFEIDYIKKFNSLVPNGYNLKQGGLNGGKHHQETKEKISNSLKGRKHIYHLGIHPLLGKKLSEETKEKISNSLKGKKYNEKSSINRNKKYLLQMKKVIKYDLDNDVLCIYKSGTHASEKNKTSKSGISMVCNGKRNQLKGFKYKYEDINITNLLNELKDLKLKKNLPR